MPAAKSAADPAAVFCTNDLRVVFALSVMSGLSRFRGRIKVGMSLPQCLPIQTLPLIQIEIIYDRAGSRDIVAIFPRIAAG